MDIDIETNQLSSATKELLLRFQVAHLHYIMRDEFHDLPGETEWLDEFHAVKKSFADCREQQIAEVGRKFNSADEEFEQECEITELENALHRLSLRVGDRRPVFFRVVN